MLGTPRTEQDLVSRHVLLLTRDVVHESQLETRIVQEQGVVLAVHMHQPFAEFAQLIQPHRGVVHEGA